LLTAVATLLLIFVGGLVTSKGAGLSVPDWPLSYGMLMPPMVGNVFYEHGHRVAATSVGFLTLVLALWTARAEARRGVRLLAWGALAAVVTQGVLGGLTVLFLLPAPISVAHACLAQAFFCLMIALAYVTSREWLASDVDCEDTRGIRTAATVATTVVIAQLLLGAVMRHIGAGLAIEDFPLANGRLLPAFESAGVAVHFTHRIGALLVLAAVSTLLVRSRRGADVRLGRPATLAFLLVLMQLCLGAWTVLSAKAELPTTFHVATGAAVLAACWFTALRAHRLLGPSRTPAGAPTLSPGPAGA
jgi:cytochrome c oxidase assembly protein subunit 15